MVRREDRLGKSDADAGLYAVPSMQASLLWFTSSSGVVELSWSYGIFVPSVVRRCFKSGRANWGQR